MLRTANSLLRAQLTYATPKSNRIIHFSRGYISLENVHNPISESDFKQKKKCLRPKTLHPKYSRGRLSSHNRITWKSFIHCVKIYGSINLRKLKKNDWFDCVAVRWISVWLVLRLNKPIHINWMWNISFFFVSHEMREYVLTHARLARARARMRERQREIRCINAKRTVLRHIWAMI